MAHMSFYLAYGIRCLLSKGTDDNMTNSFIQMHIGSKKFETMRIANPRDSPEPRDFHTACLYNNQLVIFGVFPSLPKAG